MYDPFSAKPPLEEAGEFEPPPEQTQDRGRLEVAVADRSLRFAMSLMDKVCDRSGKIKQGVDLKEGERVLVACRNVIDRANKARHELQKFHEQATFETAVIEAARKLPREMADQFLRDLETGLGGSVQ